ncbi:MAG: hypothetical protein MRY49_01500 [Candidatus Pacebacteria bacterium]|nr:hypothetical protein [Candidatus Paceibacterota bacterium]
MKKVILAIIFILIFLLIFSYRPAPRNITYGMSFSRFRTNELNLSYEKTYLAIMDDLGVRNFRFSAHWPITEANNNQFNFYELDFQIKELNKRDGKFILSVGKRLPRWPECHVPEWAKDVSEDELQEEILDYITEVVLRYKDEENMIYWQVENEPFLALFAEETCPIVDVDFLKKEIELVKSLDPDTPVLVTDSGNLGTWYEPWKLGDAFGTSLYRYFWNPEIGTFKSRLPASFFKLKHNVVRLISGDKPTMIIELSAEPWLVDSIINTDIDIQLQRMDIDKFKEIISFAEKTGFDQQYLWGAEWWYWMRENGHPEFWQYGKEILQ